MPLSVAISVAVHAGVAAGLAWWPSDDEDSARDAAPASPPIEIVAVIEPVPVEPVPFDVVFVPELSANPPAPPPARDRAAAARPAIAAPTTARSEPGESAGEPAASGETAPGTDGTTKRAPLFTMRGTERPRLDLPAGRWDAIDHVPKGTTPERSERTGILRNNGGGSYRSNQDVFSAEVHPDGSVDLKDAKNLRLQLALPKAKHVGKLITQWLDSDKGKFGREGDASLGKDIQVGSGNLIDPEDEGSYVVIPILRAKFDVTDWIMRSKGIDPYSSKKRQFLDATFKERVQIGKRHRAAQLGRSAELIYRSLKALAASDLDAGERKQALFELWDDCIETGEPEVVRANQSARAMVIGFIRTNFPAGSAHAYTADELAALAKIQKSQTPFQPYEPTPSE